MGFSFTAFFIFVLITRTTDLDYNSEHRSVHRGDFFATFFNDLKWLKRLRLSPIHSTPRPVGGDWRGGRSRPVDELVALRFSPGLRYCGGTDAGLPRGLRYPLHSSR